jgi:hypothetical protein
MKSQQWMISTTDGTRSGGKNHYTMVTKGRYYQYKEDHPKYDQAKFYLVTAQPNTKQQTNTLSNKLDSYFSIDYNKLMTDIIFHQKLSGNDTLPPEQLRSFLVKNSKINQKNLKKLQNNNDEDYCDDPKFDPFKHNEVDDDNSEDDNEVDDDKSEDDNSDDDIGDDDNGDDDNTEYDENEDCKWLGLSEGKDNNKNISSEGGAALTDGADSTVVAASTDVIASTDVAVAFLTDVAASTDVSASTGVAASTDVGATTNVAVSTDIAASTRVATDVAPVATHVTASTGVSESIIEQTEKTMKNVSEICVVQSKFITGLLTSFFFRNVTTVKKETTKM